MVVNFLHNCLFRCIFYVYCFSPITIAQIAYILMIERGERRQKIVCRARVALHIMGKRIGIEEKQSCKLQVI